MKLKLTLQRRSGPKTDIVVTADAVATVGAIAQTITRLDPLSDESSGEPDMTSRSAPSLPLRIIRTETDADGRTVAVTPSLMTIPAPILPDTGSESPCTCRKYPEI